MPKGSIALPLIASMVVWSAICWLQLFRKADERDLWSSHEARAGMNARQILASGLWYLPGRGQGAPDLQKPPGYYWAVASFACLGSNLGAIDPSGRAAGEVDAWAIRLPSLVAALIAALLVIFLGIELGYPWAGMFGSLVLLTAGHFAWGARIGRIDMPLAAVIAASGWLQLRLLRTQSSFDLIFLSSILGAGILFKGPIAVVLSWATSAAVVFYAHLTTKPTVKNAEKNAVKNDIGILIIQLGISSLLGVCVSLPWFICAHGATEGEFTRLFFIEHNWDRGFGTGRLRAHPFYFYLPQFGIDFLPWTALGLGVVLFLCWKRQHYLWDQISYRNPGVFCCAWFLSIFLLLSASQYKRADYLLPAYPAAALALGFWLAGCARGWDLPKWSAYRSSILVLGISSGALGMFYLVDVQLPSLEPYRDSKVWAREIQSRIPADEPLVFFAEEAHAVAFHLDRGHSVLGKPDELVRFFEDHERIWVITNPEVLRMWPEGPLSIRWRIASRNGDLLDPAQHKHLVLLEAVPRRNPLLTKAMNDRGED